MVESGLFYSTVLDPVLKQLRKRVALHIKRGDRVIDIACGTGAQLFVLVDCAGQLTGVDLSQSMVGYAEKMAKRRNLTNVNFYVGDATNLSPFYGQKFDLALLSLALHQFSPDLRIPILDEIQKIADKVILLDYAVPLPKNATGLVCKIAEFMAGRSHNHNFKNYTLAGGLAKILPGNGYSVQKSQIIGKGAFHLMVATKNV